MHKLCSILAGSIGAHVGRQQRNSAMLRPPTNLAVLASQVSVYASGLNNPRGLKFGPDGNLYVAEGGKGGTNLPVDDPACVVDATGRAVSG